MESVAIATMKVKAGPLTHTLKVMSDSTSKFATDIQKSTAAASKDLDAYVKEQERLQNVAAARAKSIQQAVAQITEKETAHYKRNQKARSQSAKAAFEEMFAAEEAHNKNVSAARAKALSQTVASLTSNESRQRKAELSALRKAIEEEAAIREAGMRRREATLRAQKALTDRYNGMELAAQVRHLERMQRVIAAGDTPITRVARQFGTSALRDYGNLEAMKAQVEAQKQADKSVRSLATGTQTHANATVAQRHAMATATSAMRDMHSTARGLAGSLNMLWLTWGAMAPIAGGAAVGGMVRGAYQTGKELEYQLKFVEALGNRAVGMSDIMPSVLGSMFKPTEVAQGMRQLAQAGLDTQEALATLPTTLQLATLGEMSVADAALHASSAIATFNLEVHDASRVGDVFAKAAAVSNTSVSGIAEAMRQAGSASAMYNVSLEETTAMLTVLAKRGIFGSAAGTAVKNFQREIFAPVEKASKALEEVGVKAFDEVTGRARKFTDVLDDMADVYASLNEEQRAAWTKDVFNERGMRAAQAILSDPDDYKKQIEQLQSAQGFLAQANAKMLDTVEGAQNRLQSTMQQSFTQAFDKVKGDIRSTLESLDRMFASQGFVNFVTTITGAVAGLTSTLADNSGFIARAIGVYAVYRAGLGTAAALTDILTRSKATNTNATLANAAASNANTVAKSKEATATNLATVADARNTAGKAAAATTVSTWISRAGTLLRMVNGIGVALGVGILGWQAWKSATSDATSTNISQTRSLNSMSSALAKQNEALAENIRLRRQQAANFETTPLEDARRSARASAAAAQMQLSLLKTPFDSSFKAGTITGHGVAGLVTGQTAFNDLLKQRETADHALKVSDLVDEQYTRSKSVQEALSRQEALVSEIKSEVNTLERLTARHPQMASYLSRAREALAKAEAINPVVDQVIPEIAVIKRDADGREVRSKTGEHEFEILQHRAQPTVDPNAMAKLVQFSGSEWDRLREEIDQNKPGRYTGVGDSGGSGVYRRVTQGIERDFQARNQLLVNQRNFELKLIEEQRKVGLLSGQEASAKKESVWAEYEKGATRAGQAAVAALRAAKAPSDEIQAAQEKILQARLDNNRAEYEQAEAQSRQLEVHNAIIEAQKTLNKVNKDREKARLDSMQYLKDQKAAYDTAYMSNDDVVRLEARNKVEQEYSAVIDSLKAQQASLRKSLGEENYLRDERYQNIVDTIEALKGEEEATKALVAAEAARMWKEQNTVAAGLARGFRGYANDIKKIGDQTANATDNVLKSLESGLADVFAKGKLDARSFGDVVIQELTRIMARQAMMNLLGEKAGGSGDGLIGGLFNAGLKLIGAGGGNMPVNTVNTGTNFGSFPVVSAHGGGIAGGHAARSRAAEASIFHGAPRFHTGGIIGAGEVPIIAQRGEGVFTPEQMKNLAPVGTAPTIVINQTVQVDSRADRASIIQGMQAAKASAMQEIAEQFHRDGPMRRIAT